MTLIDFIYQDEYLILSTTLLTNKHVGEITEIGTVKIHT